MSHHLTPAPCCGQPPTLRVVPIASDESYVQYACRICGNGRGLAINEDEAWSYWQPLNVPAYRAGHTDQDEAL